MRQPVKDERFTDPEGNRWQVLEVGRWRTGTKLDKNGRAKPRGKFTAAYYVMTNAAGEQKKVQAHKMVDWIPDTDESGDQIGDPLQGRRVEITKAVRAGKGVLIFRDECPVGKGERYHLAGGEIVIGKVTPKTNKRMETYTEVAITYIGKDKVYFLRNTVPSARPDELVKPPTADDIERARIDGNYLTGAPEQGGDELATVPPDWEDRGAMKRKGQAIDDRDAQRRADDLKRQRKTAKSTLDAVLSGLTPENQQILLAKVIADCKDAQMEDVA